MLMTNITVSGSTNENVGPKLKKSKLLTLLGDVFEHTSSPSLTPQNAAKKQLDQYKTEEPVIENPLEWWEKNKERFPGLAALAKRYLSITATSVPSERAFSLAGHIVNAKRSCLLPENMRMLLFLAENLEDSV